MISVYVATSLAFLSGSLMITLIAVNVTSQSPADWAPEGRAKCYFWSFICGLSLSAVTHACLSGAL